MIRILPATAALVLLASCSSLETSFDYDTKVDFERLSTYAWIVTGDASLTGRRITSAVDDGLARRGYHLVAEAPDFMVAAHVGKQQRLQVSDWGYSYAGHAGAWYGGSDYDVYTYEQGTLVLDIIDAKSRAMIWRGSASRVIDPSWTPEERDKIVDQAVQALLEHFPPKP